MREIRAYTMHHEPHRDCRCSARVLDAVDDYIARGHAGLKRKPLNLIRKWKASPSDALLSAAGDVPPLIACEKRNAASLGCGVCRLYMLYVQSLDDQLDP